MAFNTITTLTYHYRLGRPARPAGPAVSCGYIILWQSLASWQAQRRVVLVVFLAHHAQGGALERAVHGVGHAADPSAKHDASARHHLAAMTNFSLGNS